MTPAPDTYRPQWAYVTPPGYRDEVYEQPFGFTLVANGTLYADLPIQIDDDADFIVRKIQFDQITGINGALARLRDAFGNPITVAYDTNGNYAPGGLVPGLGYLASFGLPLEGEIFCPAGSVLRLDLQPTSNGNLSQLGPAPVGTISTVSFYARLWGAAGNNNRIIIQNPGLALQPLTITVALVGITETVTVSLATDGVGALISTVDQVIALINGTPAAAALMSAVLISGPGTDIAQPYSSFFPVANNGFAVTFAGLLLGVKRFKEC